VTISALRSRQWQLIVIK